MRENTNLVIEQYRQGWGGDSLWKSTSSPSNRQTGAFNEFSVLGTPKGRWITAMHPTPEDRWGVWATVKEPADGANGAAAGSLVNNSHIPALSIM